MSTNEFVDYYELLECSPNASLATIERLFRYLVKENHPDVAQGGDRQKLSKIVEGFQALRNPETRAEYDRQYQNKKRLPEMHSSAESLTINDTDDRYKILSTLYNRRRKNMKQPGLPMSTVGELTGCDESAIEFHLWYFMQKDWVKREETGVLSITAQGVDRIDEINLSRNQNGPSRLK